MQQFRRARGGRDSRGGSRGVDLKCEKLSPCPLCDRVNRPWKAVSGTGHERGHRFQELR